MFGEAVGQSLVHLTNVELVTKIASKAIYSAAKGACKRVLYIEGVLVEYSKGGVDDERVDVTTGSRATERSGWEWK